MATREVTVVCRRDGIAQTFGPFTIETPVARFVTKARAFLTLRKWTVERVDQ